MIFQVFVVSVFIATSFVEAKPAFTPKLLNVKKSAETDYTVKEIKAADAAVFDSLQVENKLLREDILFLKRLIVAQKKAVKDYKVKVQDITSKFQKSEVESEARFKKYQETTEQTHQDELNLLKDELIQKHQMELAEIKVQLEELTKNYQHLEMESEMKLERLQDSLEQTHQDELYNLKEDLIQEHQQEMSRIKQQLRELTKSYQQLEIDSEQKLEQLQESLEQSHQEDINNLKEELFEQHQHEISRMKQQIQDLTQDYQQLEIDSEQKIEQVRETIEQGHQDEINSIREELEQRHQDELNALRQQLQDDAEDRIEQYKEKIEIEMNQLRVTTSQEINTLKQALNRANTEIKVKKEEIGQLRVQLSHKDKSIEMLKLEIKNALTSAMSAKANRYRNTKRWEEEESRRVTPIRYEERADGSGSVAPRRIRPTRRAYENVGPMLEETLEETLSAGAGSARRSSASSGKPIRRSYEKPVPVLEDSSSENTGFVPPRNKRPTTRRDLGRLLS